MLIRLFVALTAFALAGGLTLTSESASVEPATRLALVIGNSDYDQQQGIDTTDEALQRAVDNGLVGDLANARRDADDIAATLRSIGFEVTALHDLDRVAMADAISAFASRVRRTPRKAQIFVYYSGHGIGIGGVSYIVPTGAALDHEALLAAPDAVARTQVLGQSLIRADALVDATRHRRADIQLVVFDSCRDNPWISQLPAALAAKRFTRAMFASSAYGMAVSSGGGSRPKKPIVAYATSEDRPSLDDNEGSPNSPYATALIQHLPDTRATVRDVMRRVAADVARATKGRQRPYATLDAAGAYRCFAVCAEVKD